MIALYSLLISPTPTRALPSVFTSLYPAGITTNFLMNNFSLYFSKKSILTPLFIDSVFLNSIFFINFFKNGIPFSPSGSGLSFPVFLSYTNVSASYTHCFTLLSNLFHILYANGCKNSSPANSI